MTPSHPQVYPVEEDTLLLRDAAVSEVRPSDRVLEIGTGSGFIAASLVGSAMYVVGVDINPHAVRVAHACGIEVVQSDLFSGFRRAFDLVVFNPPYLPTTPDDRIDDWLELALDGGPDGRRTIARFIDGLGSVLARGGRALLLVSSITGMEEVVRMAETAGFSSAYLLERRVEDETLSVIRLRRRDPNG
jgi:release factor glutamine methyltransferase